MCCDGAQRSLPGPWVILFFATAVTVEIVPLGQGSWSPGWYRLWYYSGALLNVTLLGQGTVYLLLPRRVAHSLALIALALLLASGAVVWAAPVQLEWVAGVDLLTGKAFPAIGEAGFATPRAWAPILNIYGTCWLFGGAAWSAWRFWRKGDNPSRAAGTALIAASALVLALTSTLTNFFFAGFEEIGRLAGVALLFTGFLVASRPGMAPRKASLPAA
ncbi:MAG: hypothetical protein KatS3mg057_0138 [Herpetosiphonaceae bacterium]|nr:MAG: hypothetical protein KatS3mg057_0138 [Herpetosiphonaceae bacterium]